MQHTEMTSSGGVNQVSRHLMLVGLEVGRADALLEALSQQRGMVKAELDADAMSLHLVYNAARCQLPEIESQVQALGAGFSRRWWQRIKQGYYAFVDQNIKDNARHEPHCCSKPPPGVK